MSENVWNAPNEEASRGRLLAFVNGDESPYVRTTKLFNPCPGMPDTVQHRDDEQLRHDVHVLVAEGERLRALLNTPELHDFGKAVVIEAMHQRERWGPAHDAWKGPEDWFWTVGYLGGKALRSAIEGDVEKALHHTVTTAAVLNNWHSALLAQKPAESSAAA